MFADNVLTAWWIAFGPHGPRAESPPGEWGQVWFYTGIGVAVSAVLFLGIHSFARPPPRTMTKEWQEATNEYLKVSRANMIFASALLTPSRKNKSTRSMVSAAKVTRARVMFRASRQRLKEYLWSPRTIFEYCSFKRLPYKVSLLGRMAGFTHVIQLLALQPQ